MVTTGSEYNKNLRGKFAQAGETQVELKKRIDAQAESVICTLKATRHL